ncbi:hypothetical protein SAMN05216359_114117 [Roseateles sp. YR242]|uniref:hypothetical protein n=1 Tax=Roseateles sp. YR242 TaxID=1855305 RepID=UPI0008CFFFB0|nr:hypothetical protein [Roseateles sp. YR242]SEL71551.1 hypothetical protein SAMN05216359_114117 [Roseateles sp. YR242]
MTPINAASAVALFIRQNGIGRRQGAEAPTPPGKAGVGSSKEGGRQAVASLVLRRIKFIEPTDPDRRRKAFRIFIESVLLFELGNELINDPKFYDLVDEVESRMRGEPSLVNSIDHAADLLLAAPNG